MSDQTDPEFSDPNRIIGTPEEAKRAPEGEGSRAPLTSEGGENPQFSIFDGSGNEQVVVVTEDEQGKPIEPTGDTADEALKSVKKMDTGIGPGFGGEE
jgi:hypothetical protein